MPFLSSIASKLTGEAIKGGAEFAKTATEIPKNLVETEKAHLEVAELKAEASERERVVVPATFADVKEFDPKYERLSELEKRRKRERQGEPPPMYARRFIFLPSLPLLISVLALLALLFLAYIASR